LRRAQQAICPPVHGVTSEWYSACSDAPHASCTRPADYVSLLRCRRDLGTL
jgi:hypothetical protein